MPFTKDELAAMAAADAEIEAGFMLTRADLELSLQLDRAAVFDAMDNKKQHAAAWRRAYYEANKEKIAAWNRAYREANREEITARKRAYYEANREKCIAWQRAYYEANRDEINAKRRAQYAEIKAAQA